MGCRRDETFRGGKLCRRYVFGARALRSTTFGIRDALSFVQLIETGTLHTFRMKEQVCSAICADESKTSVSQLLDRTFGHLRVSYQNGLQERRTKNDLLMSNVLCEGAV